MHVEYLGWRDHGTFRPDWHRDPIRAHTACTPAGVPEDASRLLRFIHHVHALNDSTSPPSSTPAPILLHCSAGVGRTGTFIAISSLLPLLSHLSHNPSLSSLPRPPGDPAHPLGAYPAHRSLLVPGSHDEPVVDYVGATIDGLRDQRTTMCQTNEQVAWVWEALREAWRDRQF